jgi:ribosomal protein L11 methyltransferase
MTEVAKFFLSEVEAISLVDAMDEDETLSALSLSRDEIGDGRWQVLVYFSGDQDKAELAALKRQATSVLAKGSAKFSLETLADINWVAKSLEGLKPVAAGRFLVHGSHDRARRRSNAFNIEIEAGQAFGTGHHGTTAGCLIAIDRLARSRPIRRALDIGTGSGVLAIAIAKAAKAPVVASDIDPVAVDVAEENARLNGVARFIRTVTAANLARRVFAAHGPYDLIVANILAGPLMGLAPAIGRAVAPGGTIILSGLLPGQRARIVAAYCGQNLALVDANILDGWLTLTFRA